VPSRPSQTLQHPPSSSPPIRTRLDRILTNGLPTSTWISPRHFGPTQRYLGSLHAPSLCGAWHNGANHFGVFYFYPDFKTILDPLNSFTTPTSTMHANIAIALATTYLHHDLPASLLPPFRRVNRIAMQNDFSLAPGSCGTIVIRTTLRLTLGHIRPESINTTSISRGQYLIFHYSLLH